MSAKVKEAKPLTLSISVKGEIVKSNFDAFRTRAEERIEAINYDLKTDDDFSQAKLDEKELKEFEANLTDAEERALKEMDDVYQLIQGTRELKGYARDTRLLLSRKVKERNEELRASLLHDGYAALDHDCRRFRDAINAAIKGKSSLAKMQEAITEVVDDSNASVSKVKELIEAAHESHGDPVSYGQLDLLGNDPESVRVELERRIERHRAALREAELKAEAEKLRKEAEEKAKAERESTLTEREIETSRTEEESPFAETPKPAAAQPVEAPANESAEEEMTRFLSALMAAFAPVKELRGKLKHPENIERAAAFADALGSAWKQLKA